MRPAALLAALAAAASLGACATTPPKTCRGLPKLETVSVRAPDGTVARRAAYADEAARLAYLHCFVDAGIQSAEVELARRYETGDGVAQDIARAAELYERAAADVPMTTPIYSPPVTRGGAGRVILVQNPNGQTASPEAMYRLGLMLVGGRGVLPDPRRGRQLIERAASAGYPEARAWVEANPATRTE